MTSEQRISIGTIEAPVWERSVLSKLSAGQVHVYLFDISAQLLRESDLIRLLSLDERNRASRYHQKKDKQRFIISRAMQRHILSSYIDIDPSLLKFTSRANGKPCLTKDWDWLHYNISHSGDHILLMVSRTQVGADIEWIDLDFNFKELLEGSFNKIEMDYILEKDSRSRFYELWTRKEAFFKATGQGLTDDLPLFSAMSGIGTYQDKALLYAGDWQLRSFQLQDQYMVCIASSGHGPEYRFIHCNL